MFSILLSTPVVSMVEVEEYLKNAENAFLILSPNGSIFWASVGFYNMYKYSSEEYIEQHGNKMISLDNEFNELLEKLINEKQPIHTINKCYTKDNELIWVQTNLTPIFNGENKLDKIVAVETDITQLKETEEDLNQQHEQMLSVTEYLEEANKQLESQKEEIEIQRKAIEDEQQRSERLLLNMFPEAVAHQLKKKGKVRPREFNVTVLFADFKNFTKTCEKLKPKEIVEELNFYFEHYDDIIGNHFVEKIKTIGDAYLCVGGLPFSNKSHPFNIVLAALQIQRFMNELNDEKVLKGENIWELRCGIHTGDVVAGVVGKRKYVYDIWGDTVNIASRMETHSHVGMVNVSGATYEVIKDHFDCTHRGKMEVKNKGKIDMYFVIGIKKELAQDKKRVIPNEKFRKYLDSL